MNQPRRIALIVWRWKDLQPLAITQADLANFPADDPASWKGVRFDEYRVAVRRDPPQQHRLTADLVVRIHIAKDAGPHAAPLLRTLAAWYQQESASDIYVFLHRNDGFDGRSVSQLYEEPGVNKCFLFSDGHDYLYFSTQEAGLLGDNGRFFVQRATDRRPGVQVADNKSRLVFKIYFDRTWAYYSSEYDTKLLELKEDLLDYYLLKLDDLDSTVTLDYWRQLLQADHNLYLRIKSLVTDHRLSPREIDHLRALEKKRQKSYTFDDFRSYIEQRKAAGPCYRQLTDSLAAVVDEAAQSGRLIDSPRTRLREWQQRFQQLSHKLIR